MKKIAELYKKDKPREKLISKGVEALKNEELMAVLIGSGVQGNDVRKLSKEIISVLNAGLDGVSLETLSQKKYDKNIPMAILKKIKANFEGLINSKDKLKYQMLSNYQFMIGMPRYEDMIEVAMGSDLLKNIQGKSQVVFQQKLPNGAILFGMQFREPTQKFPYQIGTNNAVLLPYPVLIKEKKAYIMNPKYYISIMYPLLKMSQFMAISTIPGAILKEAQSVFRKGR
ncbi:MAG: hypothetical protein LGB01_06270 [Sulfurovum sp.]|nr:hypothetical protein [Sulfurovum sp.]